MASENATRSPLGSAIVTGSGKSPQCNAWKAARAAAVAQLPVVHSTTQFGLRACFLHQMRYRTVRGFCQEKCKWAIRRIRAPAPTPRGLIIAAPRSGSGKTTVTLGIQRALSRRGLNVQPFKCGPDYIDPAFHSAAARRPSFNLDSWAFTRAQLAELLARGERRGYRYRRGLNGFVRRRGATRRFRRRLECRYRRRDRLARDSRDRRIGPGPIRQPPSRWAAGSTATISRWPASSSNRVASPRHDMLLRKGMEKAGIPVLGAMPKRADLVLPERHLGLVQAGDTADLAARLDALADFAQDHIDLDALTALAAPLAAFHM